MRLRECAQNALNSALQLVSEASGVSIAELQRMYQVESVGEFFEKDPAWEQDMIDEDDNIEVNPDQQVENVFKHIGEVAAEEYADHGEGEDQEDDPHIPNARDSDVSLPDGLTLVELTADALPTEDRPYIYN